MFIWIALGLTTVTLGNYLVRNFRLGHLWDYSGFMSRRYIEQCANGLRATMNETGRLDDVKNCTDLFEWNTDESLCVLKPEIFFDAKRENFRINVEAVDKNYYFPFFDKTSWYSAEGNTRESVRWLRSNKASPF
jgi:hypothetical protein